MRVLTNFDHPDLDDDDGASSGGEAVEGNHSDLDPPDIIMVGAFSSDVQYPRPDLAIVIIKDGAAALFTDLLPAPSALAPGPPTPASTPVRFPRPSLF